MKINKNEFIRRTLITLVFTLSIVFLGGGILKVSAREEGLQIFKGYIIDEDCFVNPDYVDPLSETRGCQLMPNCASSGYGIAVLQADGYYKFYYFDGDISTVNKGKREEVATNGQEKAWDFIKNSVVDRNVPVTVKAMLTSNTRTNPSTKTADGIKYSVLHVESINTTKDITPYKAKITGYLVDAQWYLDTKTKATDPNNETRTTLKNGKNAQSGYGVSVMQKNGTYKFYYFDGDFAPNATSGQKKASEILNSTKKTKGISVDVTGELKGHFNTLQGQGPEFKQYPSPVVAVTTLSQTTRNYVYIFIIVFFFVIIVAVSSVVIIKRRDLKHIN